MIIEKQEELLVDNKNNENFDKNYLWILATLEQIQIKTKRIRVGHEELSIEYEEGTV